MRYKNLLAILLLGLFQMGCARTPLKPQVAFPSTATPPPTTQIRKNTTETYEFTDVSRPVITRNANPEPDTSTIRPQPKPLSPAVIALVTDADKKSKAGNLEAAIVNIERALRIKPRDATLTYKLASLRLKQSKPRLAEDLGRKAALLAGADKALKKRCWLLIAQARHLQQNPEGVREALLKAKSLD